MKILTTHELHYIQYKDGIYDPQNHTVGGYFDDLLAIYDEVILVARCRKTKTMPSCQRVDNYRVKFIAVRDFSGYTGFLGRFIAFLECKKSIGAADRYWLRSPGFIASMVAFWLRRSNIKYYCHVVGDPADVAKTKVCRLPRVVANYIVRHIKIKFQKFMKNVSGAVYVTQSALQQKYPSSIPENDFGVSDVNIHDWMCLHVKRDFESSVFKIIVVGILLRYKGYDYLLRALSKIHLKQKWELIVIGDGPEREKLSKLAKDLGINRNIIFGGWIDQMEDLIEKLDQAHLFVLSSLTEGMPRVVLEAMARGLPVIATEVGGVPEIVEPEYLVPPEDSDELAKKISWLGGNTQELRAASEYNFKKALRFKHSKLSRLRRAWFDWLREYGNSPDTFTWWQWQKKSAS